MLKDNETGRPSFISTIAVIGCFLVALLGIFYGFEGKQPMSLVAAAIALGALTVAAYR